MNFTPVPVSSPGKYVIASIPPNQLVPIRFDPPLSPIKQEMNRSVMPGNLIKFLVTFEKVRIRVTLIFRFLKNEKGS